MELAIGNVARWGDTDIFPRPIDNHVIADERSEFKKLLVALDKNVIGDLQKSPIDVVRSATPVGYSGFRWGTQIDPVWNAYLLATVLDFAEDIEASRVDPNVVFSHRIDPSYQDDRLFREGAFSGFIKESRRLSQRHKYVVVTDIADFYGRIYHHRLENSLQAVPNDGGRSHVINEILKSVADGTSYGLPVGGPAARILSEVLLDKVDRGLLAAGIQFVRYADDYRIFAQSEDAAYGKLATLADLLSTEEGLALSKAKTRVMKSGEYVATVSIPSLQGARLSGTELKARQLLNFSLRFDPYSPDPEADFDELAREVDALDLVDLFSVELNKSRVDPQFTKKLLKAIQFAKSDVKSAVAESLCLNLPLLAPVFPQVMGAVKGIWSELSDVARESIVAEVAQLWSDDSYLLRPGVSRSYTVRVLAGDSSDESEKVLRAMFDHPHSDAAVKRDVILAMANRKVQWWLSARQTGFGALATSAERRAFLVATPVMTEQAGHFLKRLKQSFSPLESITAKWAKQRLAVDPAWLPPV